MITQAMVMAAGLGTRLAPFTQLRSKVLLPVFGTPMIQYTTDALQAAGVRRIVANVHHDALQIRTELPRLIQPLTELILSDETALLRGSGGGLRQALPFFKGAPFFFANADVLSDFDWNELALEHARLRRRWGVQLTLGIHPSGPGTTGYREIHFDPYTRLITRLGIKVSGRPFFMGAGVLEPEALAEVPVEGVADFAASILEPAILKGKAAVFCTDRSWFDIGSPELWLQTHLELINRLELGFFRSREAREWRKQIEANHLRIAPRTWIHKDAVRSSRTQNWRGPCYWNPLGSVGEVPAALGPAAVLYGDAPAPQTLEGGIGFGGAWVRH